jgi:hypothetical protein
VTLIHDRFEKHELEDYRAGAYIVTCCLFISYDFCDSTFRTFQLCSLGPNNHLLNLDAQLSEMVLAPLFNR